MGAEGVMNTTEMQRKHRNKYDNPRPKSQLQLTKDWLKERLSDGAPVLKSVLVAEATEKGLGTSYLDEAKRSMQMIVERDPENKTQWTWRLPDEKMVAAAQVAKEATVDPGRTHHACEDEFSLTVAERKQYGIRDDEQVCWIRDPGYWKGKEPGDPARMFMRNNAGGRVVTDKNGEHIGNGIDVILAVRPMAEVEALRAREQAAANRENKAMQQGLDGNREDDFDKTNAERLRARIRQNSREHEKAGMIGMGSPSSGMNYEDYVKNRGLSQADIDAEEMRHSLRGRASREYSQEEYQQQVAEARRAGGGGGGRGREAGGGKFVSIPANVRPRNLAAR